jgi:hypothetical protein
MTYRHIADSITAHRRATRFSLHPWVYSRSHY